MARITKEQAGGNNVLAFLDLVAHSEIGDAMLADPASDDGYRIIVGSVPGKLITFDDYNEHPARLIKIKMKNGVVLNSTAAGRYQFIRRTWLGITDALGLVDFTPSSQDYGCIELIREAGAYGNVVEGKIEDAIHECRSIWASFPGADYGQPEHTTQSLLDHFYNVALPRYA